MTITATRWKPAHRYLTLSAVHGLLVELLSDGEVDLGGAEGGGGFDVEMLAVLLDLHVGFRRSRYSHLSQHGVDA